MPKSICDTYPGICEKSRLSHPRPPRLLRPANDNIQNISQPRLPAPEVTAVLPLSEGTSVITTASAISMLGLVLLAGYMEVAVVTVGLVGALGGFFSNTLSLPW
ncbi:hypothetical protein [Ensifer sp. MJa1]|uniref:hypothetical protein n=1 Tax=Ensifer sp. MJa1 TaxID=2919888 RepID=UPI003008E2E8